MYVIDATCFDECFLFHVIAGRRYFFSEFVVTVRFFQPPYCRFLWNKCFERSPYFTLHNNCLVLVLMLSSEKSYHILYLYILEKRSYVADIFVTFFTLFLTAPHFLYKTLLLLFFWKTQNEFESMFLNIVELINNLFYL